MRLLVILSVIFICRHTYCQSVGIGTTTPNQKLDINGKLKLADDNMSPSKGTIRWNETAQDFEGFDGIQWLSLTQTNNTSSSTSTVWPSDCSTTGTIGDYAMASATDGVANDQFGQSVSIFGNTAAIGVRQDDGQKGAVFIYNKTSQGWVESFKIVAGDGASGDQFGYDVDLFEDYLVVGCPFDNDGVFTDKGSVYVFKRSGNSWAQQTKLLPSDVAQSDQFGISVSIDSIRIVAGVTHGDGVVANSGAAYIFKLENDVWTQEAKIFASNGAEPNQFGTSVTISGNKVVCGDLALNSNMGGAYFFLRTGSSWQEIQIITPADGAASDNFGNDLDLYKNYLIVGSRFHDLPTGNAGAAYVYSFNGSDFVQETKITGTELGEFLGSSVAIHEGYFLIGSINSDVTSSCPGTHTNQGMVKLYKLIPGGFINFITNITDAFGLINDQFGFACSIYKDQFIIGAPQHDINGKANKGKIVFGNVD